MNQKLFTPHSLLLNLIFLFFINMENIPKNEGERFIEFVRKLSENKKCDLYLDGPCSRAEILSDNWR